MIKRGDVQKKREHKIKKIISREYRIFQEEEKLTSLPRSLYEKACNRSERIIKVSPGKKGREKIQDAIDFSHLNVTPEGVASLSALIMVIAFLVVGSLMATQVVFHEVDDKTGRVVHELIEFGENEKGQLEGFSGISVSDGAVFLIIILIFSLYIYNYPQHLKKRYRIEAGSDLVVMVLYMAMYMRNTPNLERAVRFASENISGFLGFELKKLLWDVEVGNYLSMQEALIAYTKKWEDNRDFVEAIETMMTSLTQKSDRRIKLLDESVDIMLEGTQEQAKHFNQKLKMPVMIVHALGIILPIMGLVLFPIIAIFLGVDASVLFITYDIILPVILYFVIKKVLELRPATFSRIDISENPNVPSPGRFRADKKEVKAWPVAVISGAIVMTIGVVLINAEAARAAELGTRFDGIMGGLVFLFGIALGIGVYYMLLARDRTKVRKATRKIENEFAEALFQLGSQVSGGSPIEMSIEKSMSSIDNLKIKDLFKKALNNMKMLGMTFSQAFFDEKRGAIQYFPSRLIKSVMRTVVESTKKGVVTAAAAMLSVSRYLKGLHNTQEKVQEELSDTLNSLKFQLYFLSPMISAIVVVLAIIIVQILQQLSATAAATTTGAIPFLDPGTVQNVTPLHFVIVVGIYLIQSSFLISMFINSLENGEDPVGWYELAGSSMIVSFIVFIMIFSIVLMIFGPLITSVI